MDLGVVLPTMGEVASVDAIERFADLAGERGWRTVWTTDHVLVPAGPEGDEYGNIFEALTTLAFIAARSPSLRLGTSALIVGMRQASLLAKELATLDTLSGGRVIAGISIGDQPLEFANLERADRYRRRAAYLEETVALWRHLWSGSTAPFAGTFVRLEDYVFSPLPVQGSNLPIWIGGSSEAAIRRAGRIGDGYHATKASPDQISRAIPLLREASGAVRRPTPAVSVRLRVRFGNPRADVPYMLGGSAYDMAVELDKFARLGVAHLALLFDGDTLGERLEMARRFDREVSGARVSVATVTAP